MTRRSLLPLAAGVVAALVLWLTLPHRRVYVEAAPWLIAVVVGVGATVALLVAGRRRRTADVRQRRRADEVRAAGEQSRRRFVQRLDHELKNPLTALLTALSSPLGGPVTEDRAVAHAQADRIRRLLTDLRRVADVETVDLDRAPVDVAVLLDEAVETAVADTGTTQRLRIDVPTAPWPLPLVHGDSDLLLVAVYNVVVNAIKYTDDAGVIEVRASEAPGARPGVLIEVADTGCGIAEDEQQIVWEELARGRSASAVPGSGVGLALVRVIIERHGGTVAIRSRVGHGTSVLLHLPAP